MSLRNWLIRQLVATDPNPEPAFAPRGELDLDAPIAYTLADPDVEDFAGADRTEIPAEDREKYLTIAQIVRDAVRLEMAREEVESTPLYDDVVAESQAADGLAAEIEGWLASQSGGAA